MRSPRTNYSPEVGLWQPNRATQTSGSLRFGGQLDGKRPSLGCVGVPTSRPAVELPILTLNAALSESRVFRTERPDHVVVTGAPWPFDGWKGISRQKPVTTASRTLDRLVSDLPVTPIHPLRDGTVNNRPLRLSSFI